MGALVGAGLGLALTAVAPSAGAPSFRSLAVAATLLSLPLGWLFARRALTPGLGNALAASAGITAIAVPVGALGVALAMALGGGGAPDVLGAVLFGVVFGLLVLGLPMACLTFAVAGVWVVLVRVLARPLGVPVAADLWG